MRLGEDCGGTMMVRTHLSFYLALELATKRAAVPAIVVFCLLAHRSVSDF